MARLQKRFQEHVVDINEIQRLASQGDYEFSIHGQQERLNDDLDIVEIEEAIIHGEILEEYPHNPRGESCLVLGYAGTKPIHAVLGWARRRDMEEKVLRVITVYGPQLPKWKDPRTRGGMP